MHYVMQTPGHHHRTFLNTPARMRRQDTHDKKERQVDKNKVICVDNLKSRGKTETETGAGGTTETADRLHHIPLKGQYTMSGKKN